MGDYWDVTASILQPFVAKPTLKPALLQKPPFRFLHDINTAVIQSTGFLTGLWAADQLDSQNVKEKDQKINYLKRLQLAVQLAIGSVIDVDPGKIILGQEPEKTNALLQGLAGACQKAQAGQINMADIVAGVDAGKVPGGAAAAAPPPARAAPPPAAAPAPVAAAAPVRAAAPAPSSGGGALRPSRAPIELPPGDGSEDYAAITTRVIGALIEKPKMVDKLLRKPPFRFIHDIVTAVMAVTTYPDGYFSADELNSATLSETNAKLAWLQKLIDLVAATNNVDLSLVNPKKIAAGLEPEHTNTLLQQFAYAAASGIAASDVMAKMAAGGGGAPAAAEPADDGGAAAAAAAEQARKAKAAADAEARKAAALAASQEKEKAAAAAAAAAASSKPMPKLGLNSLSNSEAGGQQAAADDEAQVRTKIERPKTARKAPPKLPSNLIDEKKAEPTAAASPSEEKKEPASRVIAEGDNQADPDDEEEEPASNVGAEALAGFDSGEGARDDDGGLVRSMKDKLKGAQSNDGGMKIRSSATVAGAGGMSAAQIDDLRKSIQNLCQSVNPLGKCVDFVREDVDSMGKELQRWRTIHGEFTEQLEQERRATERIVEPLTNQLNEVELQILEQKRKIHSIKGVILRNDAQIASLLDSKTTINP